MQFLYLLFVLIVSFSIPFVLLISNLFLMDYEVSFIKKEFLILISTVFAVYYVFKYLHKVQAFLRENLYYKKEIFVENGKKYIRKTNLNNLVSIYHNNKLHYEQGHAIYIDKYYVRLVMEKSEMNEYFQFWYDGKQFFCDTVEEFSKEIEKYKLKKSITTF